MSMLYFDFYFVFCFYASILMAIWLPDAAALSAFSAFSACLAAFLAAFSTLTRSLNAFIASFSVCSAELISNLTPVRT